MKSTVVEVYRVISENSGNEYTVSRCSLEGKSLEESEHWKCDCRGWTMHTPRRDCKHIRHVRAHGGIPMDPMLSALDKAQRKAVRLGLVKEAA